MKFPDFAQAAIKYTSANLINAIVPILLLPLLTAYLSKEDYGLVSLFQVLVMISLPFIGFSASAAIEREYYDNKENFAGYLSNGVFIVLISGFLLLLISLIFGKTLESITDFPEKYFWAIAVYCMCNNTSEIILSYWRLHNNTSQYAFFRIGRTVVEVSLSFFLVALFSKGWLGRLDAIVVAAFLFFCLTIILLKKNGLLKLVFNTRYLKSITQFGLPLVPHALGGMILVYSDRIFITKMVGLAEMGSYTVGYQVAMAISLLQSSFNLAWVPWFYGKLSQNDDTVKLKIVKFTYLYNILILICAIVLILAAPLIFKVFINKNYYDSIQFVSWISIGFAFDGMYKMVVGYIFYLRRTKLISIITALTAILNLALNYLLIKKMGPIGAAMSTAICLFLEYMVVWFISSRLYKMPWLYFIPIESKE